jgi:hypothetical protein
MQPVIPWLQKVLSGGPDKIFMVFWHHYSGRGGNFTHSTQHGVFFDLDDAIEYAAALIRSENKRAAIPFEEIFPADKTDSHRAHRDAVMGLLEDADSKQICLVEKAGNLLFGYFPQWVADEKAGNARLHFDYETAEDIRNNLRK